MWGEKKWATKWNIGTVWWYILIYRYDVWSEDKAPSLVHVLCKALWQYELYKLSFPKTSECYCENYYGTTEECWKKNVNLR